MTNNQSKSSVLYRLLIVLLSLAVLLPLFSINNMTVYAASYTTGTYIVSHSNGVNVHPDASISSKINGASPKGTEFKVTKVSGEMGYTTSIKTTKGTKKGWVSLKYCSPKNKASAKTNITFSSLSNIETITQGNGQHISAKINSSNSNIKSIKADIINKSTNKVVLTQTVYPNAKSYSVYNSALDNGLRFGSLSAGNYKLVYTVQAQDGTKKTSGEDSFTVKAKSIPKPSSVSSKKPTPATNTATSSIKVSKLKDYSGKTYTNYYVVKGYDPKYCYNQYDYNRFWSKKQKKNVGCTAVSYAMILSMDKGKKVSPNNSSEIPWGSAGASYPKTQAIGYNSLSKQFSLAAEQLQKGKAVWFRANSSHTVVVIGIRKNANLSKLKASDFLIIDPAGGKVTTLDNAAHGCSYASGWYIRVVK